LLLDLNKDGFDDLVLYETPALSGPGSPVSGQPYKLQLLISNGDGTFRDETNARLPVQSSTGIHAPDVSVGDINSDGLPDLLVSLFSPDFSPARNVSDFFVNQGGGVFL
jgi:hypothetical protein